MRKLLSSIGDVCKQHVTVLEINVEEAEYEQRSDLA